MGGWNVEFEPAGQLLAGNRPAGAILRGMAVAAPADRVDQIGAARPQILGRGPGNHRGRQHYAADASAGPADPITNVHRHPPNSVRLRLPVRAGFVNHGEFEHLIPRTRSGLMTRADAKNCIRRFVGECLPQLCEAVHRGEE